MPRLSALLDASLRAVVPLVVAPPTVDRLTLRLLGQYRLLMLLILAAVYYLPDYQNTLGTRDPALFEFTHFAYTILTLAFLLAGRLHCPRADTQLYLQSYADIALVALLIYASGGVKGDLGAWLLINMALLSHFLSLRHALLFAAIASLIVVSGEFVAALSLGADAADFERTAVLGGSLFVVAWLMSVPVRRLAARQITAPTADRAGLDLQQIAELNEEIVRELDSGVVAVDANRRVVLVNDTARTLLGVEFTALPLPLSKLSPSLHANVREATLSPNRGARAFTVELTGQSVLPRYLPLSAGGMLIRLDDHAHIRQQLQQLKLASLGRLSASIAHEIRNPLGAISHAVQLIEESSTLEPTDAKLLSLARRHTVRIDRIVNDVLQLSNRQQVSTDPIDIGTFIENFCERFRAENALKENELVCHSETALHGVFDPGHLDQVLWNLCMNARLHNDDGPVHASIDCFTLRPRTVIIEVADDGRGITDIDREQLFEPFYSTHHSGSGLGLYIIRELCEMNHAEIECLHTQRGARFRITINEARQMAA